MAAGTFANAKDFIYSLFRDNGNTNLDSLQRNLDLLKDTEEPDVDLYFKGTIAEILFIKFKDVDPLTNLRMFEVWSDDSLLYYFVLDCYGILSNGLNYYEVSDRDKTIVQTPSIDPFIGNINFNSIEFDNLIFNSLTQIIQKVDEKIREKENQEQEQEQAEFDNYRNDLLTYINS